MRIDKNGYYYNRVKGKMRIAYERIKECVIKMNSDVDVEELKLSKRTVRKILKMVLNDHPEIFWVDTSFSYTHKAYNHKIVRVTPTYHYSYDEMLKRKNQIEYYERVFYRDIAEEMNEYDKAVCIHDTMADLISYEKKKMDNFESHTIYGALVEKRAVCEGYAKAYQYLLHKKGIYGLRAEGKCKGGELHEWNIININGRNVHVDVTWDAKSYDDKKTVKDISHIYFGLTDGNIRKTRRIRRTLHLPSCKSKKYMYLSREHLVAHNLFLFKKIRKIIKEDKDGQIQMRFASKFAYRRAVKKLFDKNQLQVILRKENISAKGYSYMLDKKMCTLTLTLK